MNKEDISRMNSISQIINYVVDPLNTHDELSEREYNEAKNYFDLHLRKLQLNTEHLRDDIITTLNNSSESLKTIQIGNKFEYINALMKNRSSKLVDKIKSAYRKYERGKNTPNLSKMSMDEISIVRACAYTHQWYQTLIKKDKKFHSKYNNQYKRLENEVLNNFELSVQKKINVTNRRLQGIVVRRKNNKQAVEKILHRYITQLDIYYAASKKTDVELDLNKCGIDDWYGIKVIFPNYMLNGKDITDFLISRLTSNPTWEIVGVKDYRKNVEKKINHCKIDVHHIEQPFENIEVQMTNILNNILDEFYNDKNHNKYKKIRDNQLAKCKARDDYITIEQRLGKIISLE